MPKIDSIWNLTMIGGALLEKLLLKRFLAGMAMILVFAVIIGSLIAALLMGILYSGYWLMIERGMAADTAMLIVGAVTMGLILIVALIIGNRMRALRESLAPKLPEITIPSNIGDAAEAFIDGLMTPSSEQKSSLQRKSEGCDA